MDGSTSTLATNSYIHPTNFRRAQYTGFEEIDYSDWLRTQFIKLLGTLNLFIPQDSLEGYESLIKTFGKYYRSPDSWRDIDVAEVSAESLKKAVFVSSLLMLARIRAPHPMIHSDGTIGVFWRRGDWYASLDFDEGGEHVWGATDGEQTWTGILRAEPPRIELPEQFLKAVL